MTALALWMVMWAQTHAYLSPVPIKAYYPSGCEVDPFFYGGCYTIEVKDYRALDPEPIDVPAIQDTRQVRDDPRYQLDCGLAETLNLKGLMATCLETIQFSTCADKSRVLLTSESGKKWCHKIQP
jgi:hypothetical protein